MHRPQQQFLSRVQISKNEGNEMRLKLLQLSSGDASFAEMLKTMIWQAYCDVNCPYGHSEDGMFAWWAREQQAARM